MKTRILIPLLLSLLTLASANAQRPWKEYLIPGSAMFISGFLEGTDEALHYHYATGFKPRFPNANDQYWNPMISWKNKYRNNDVTQGEKFFGSTDVFVAFTDAHHMLRLARVFTDLAAVTYCANTNKLACDSHKNRYINWKTVAQDFLVLSAIRTISFHIAYDGMFAPVPQLPR